MLNRLGPVVLVGLLTLACLLLATRTVRQPAHQPRRPRSHGPWLSPRSARRRREAAASGVCHFCEALAAELAAGAPIRLALELACEEYPPARTVATAARLGADVPTALRALAVLPGAHDLSIVAAAWEVAQRSGGGLADPLHRAASTLRERRRTAAVVAAELAPARATARMMAALPVVFLLAGSGLGGHPVRFLLSPPLGLVCLVLGLTLAALGLRWLEVIADSVEREPS